MDLSFTQLQQMIKRYLFLQLLHQMYTLNLNQCLHYDICFSYSKLNVRNFIASKFALLSSLSLSSCQSAESHPSIGKSYIRE